MSIRNRPVVNIKFTIGFGNNIFQYVFSKLLAKHHKMLHSHPNLPGFNIKQKIYEPNEKFKKILIKRKEYKTGAYKKYFDKKYAKYNIKLIGYFEDYTLYKPYLNEIRNWFPKIRKKNKKDLVIHLRLQNRLVEINHFLSLIEPKKYVSVINRFNFKKLHIVTDLEKWSKYEKKDIIKIHKDIANGPNPGTAWVSIDDSLFYVNLLISKLSKYNPVVHCTNAPTIYGSGSLRSNFMHAFNYLRSFDQIIMYNSTFSWWAAVLGNASKVAVFSLWKPSREKNSPNLGRTNYKGWFSYGSKKDLISNRKRFKKYKTLNWSQRYLISNILKKFIQFYRLITFYKKHNSEKDYH